MIRASLALLALVVLAGCGSSSSGRLTRDRYAAQADAVCAKYKSQTAALARPRSLPELAQVADKVAPTLAQARSDLSRLRPPAAEQAAAHGWLQQLGVLVGDVKAIGARARANDRAGILVLARTSLRHDRRANALARRLGMTTCSRG